MSSEKVGASKLVLIASLMERIPPFQYRLAEYQGHSRITGHVVLCVDLQPTCNLLQAHILLQDGSIKKRAMLTTAAAVFILQ